MTRKEAIAKCHGMNHPEVFVQALESLGLIEFDKPELVNLQTADGKAVLIEWEYLEREVNKIRVIKNNKLLGQAGG